MSRTRLATYGTLAPGRPNHHQISDLPGVWRRGTVRGRLVDSGWGAAMGFPALVPGDEGEVSVDLFESPALPDHWARLDAFEGEGYERRTIIVHVDGEEVLASIYAAR